MSTKFISSFNICHNAIATGLHGVFRLCNNYLMKYSDSPNLIECFWQYHTHTKPVESHVYGVPIEAVSFMLVLTETSDISAHNELGTVAGDCS